MSVIPHQPTAASGALAGKRTALSRAQITGFWAAWTGWTLDGMDSFIYALVLSPALTELLPKSGMNGSPANVGMVGSVLFALFLVGWGLAFIWGPIADRFGRTRVLAASVLAFSGLGVLSASYLLVFKRGNPFNWVILGISSVVGGMLYPVSVLPKLLQVVARLIPVTYALEGMRVALLGHAPMRELLPPLLALLAFAAVLLPISFLVFSWALRRTKITGTLTHF